jgi:hypothetical protein
MIEQLEQRQLLSQSPYGGTAWPVGGTIQAENFDVGGEGESWHDTTTGNQGNATAYRSDIDADLSNAAAPYLTQTHAGEWLEYTANIPSTSNVSITFRVASTGLGGSFHLECDGADVTGPIFIKDTAGAFINVGSSRNISLPTGEHVLRLVMDGEGPTTGAVGDFDSFTVTYRPPVKPPVGGDGTFPANPTDLVVTPVSGSQIDLTWTDNATDEYYYMVEVSTDGVYFAPYATLPANTTAASVQRLADGKQYWFKVSNGGTTPAQASGVTSMLAPTMLSGTAVSPGEIRLTWSDLSNHEDGYEIEISTDGYNFDFFEDVSADVNGFAARDLLADTTYWFRVHAWNSFTTSSDTSIQSASTLAIQPPTNLVASSVSAAEIDLNWSDNSDVESGFEIDWCANGSEFSPLAFVDADVTSFQATGLTSGTEYSFRVAAIAESGHSVFAGGPGATTRPLTPSGLSVVITQNRDVALQWNAVAGAEGYLIERSENGGVWSVVSQLPSEVATWSDSNVAGGTNYSYRIKSFRRRRRFRIQRAHPRVEHGPRGTVRSCDREPRHDERHPIESSLDRQLIRRDRIHRSVLERWNSFRRSGNGSSKYNIVQNARIDRCRTGRADLPGGRY